MSSRFVASCVAFGSALFLGVGGLGALANHVAAATSPRTHVAHHGTTVSRTESAEYLYDSGDNTAVILTSDGNRWLLSNAPIAHDCNVTVSFDNNGTKSRIDDSIVKVIEE